MSEIITIHYGINFITNKLDKKISDILKNRNIIYVLNKENKYYVNVNIKEGKLYVDDVEYQNIEEIIKNFNILTKLYIDNIDIDVYKKKLIDLEIKKNKQKHKIFNKYNRIFNKNFNVYEGINSIYEWYTGAVFFKDYEWENIENNPIKKVFEINYNNSYQYILPIDDGVLLRGANIYYYFSTDISRFEKPTKTQINKWFNNCELFINEILKALDGYNIENNNDVRLILGIIDNIRNIVLLLLNTELLSLNKEKDFIYSLNANYKNINNYIELINQYQNIILDMCLIRPLVKDYVLETTLILEKTKEYLIKTNKKIQKINDGYILSKCFNPLREIDNYFENYIVCEHSLKEIKKNYPQIKEVNLIGILYGGMELPLIMKKTDILKVNISFIFQNCGMYLDRQKKEKNIVNKNLIEIGSLNKNEKTFLVDDNMMSGITIQFIYNQLMLNECIVDGAIILRHPNINRLPQLIHFDTALNINIVDKIIFGMVTDTPYTKIKLNSNYNNMFVNELNIFSVMTEIFLKALYCNNSFIKDSQVDIFLGYSEGKK